MSSKDIRLRLVVRRHAVPEVKLVWPCAASEDLTVAKLLAQVNEVVPLESTEWGLEDYTVELADSQGGSFECLHFQPVGRLFKDDDQVIIRSLLTDDLKRRRLNGRHQISTDGKHLIDGLAFGRPWLRVPRDRPALDLPPRKRARLTYEEQQDEHDDDELGEDDDYVPDQLLLEGPESIETDEPSSIGLRALFDDADPELDDNGDLEDEDDFAPGVTEDHPSEAGGSDDELSDIDEGNLDLDEEIRLLKEDNAIIGDESEESLRVPPTLDANHASLDHIHTLRSAFPLTSISTIEKELGEHKNNLRQAYEALATSNDPTTSFDEMMDQAICGAPEAQSGLLPEDLTFNGFASQESASSGFKGFSSPRRPLIEEVVDTADLRDNREESLVSATLNGSRSNNEEVVQDSEETSSSGSSSEEEESSDSDSEDDSSNMDDSEDSDDSNFDGPPIGILLWSQYDEGDGSSSEDDSSDTSMDSDVDSQGGADVAHVEDRDDGSSDSSSDDSGDSGDSSSSEDDSDSASEPEEVTSKPQSNTQKTSSPPVKIVQEVESQVASREAPPPVAPGCGLSRTQKRNARRREVKRLKQLGALQSQSPAVSESQADSSELLARKEALLNVVSGEPQATEMETNKEVVTTDSVKPQYHPIAEASQEPTPDSAADLGLRRMKVDMGAGRRLLFGALGLKTPKSKTDEDKLRKDLMKDVRPLKNTRIEDAPSNGVAAEQPIEEDPDAWREKISYRAVECCREGVVLSEPPFPFVQRWDPQQQYTRKRKRNSQTYYDESYYDESYYDESYYDEDSQWNGNGEQGDGSGKLKKRKGKRADGNAALDSSFGTGSAADNVELDYDEPAKHPASSQFTDMDDLPSLPSDLTTLPLLKLDEVKPGMVITWQQLLMSKATNWQPQIASITGLVLTMGNENSINVLLAKRDRESDEKEYDMQTGKRVYDKFEVPEDDGEEDDGRREIVWNEISEPRLVQQAPSLSVPPTPAKGGLLPVVNSEDNKVSKSRNREEIVAEELDTQIVRAGVEAELKEIANKQAESDNSTSIPSGQNPQRPDFTADPSTNVSAESANDVLNSPSRQLVETTFAAMIEKPMTEEKVDESDQPGIDVGAMDVDAEEPSNWGSESEAIIPDSMPSLDVPSKAFQDAARLTPAMEDSGLVVPSSVSSIHSGRQPPSAYGLGESLDQEDSVVPETTPRAHETTPTPQGPAASDGSSLDSSPFPSLEEIYHTAATSRQTQSPARSTQQSVLRTLRGRVKQDPEYEEAMRQLDEGDEESDHSDGRNRSIRSLFPNATQPEPSLELPQLPSPKVERHSTPTRAKDGKSPFKVPEGSQVITLSSSPGSARFSEHYAQDSIDDTYKESQSPLPKGSGWVKKREFPKRETRSRGKSLPATSSGSPGLRTGSQNKTAHAPLVSAVSQIKARRRTTGRKF